MFNNIGKKIKALAKIICWFGIISSIFSGIVLLAFAGEFWGFAIIGLSTMIVGPLLAWISSWMLYSWGDLVDNVQAIKCKQCGEEVPVAPATTPKKQSTNKQKLTELLASGLISFEEYNKALEKEGLW